MLICATRNKISRAGRGHLCSTSECTDACRAALGKGFGSCFRLRQGSLQGLEGPITALSRGFGARPTVAKQRACDFHSQPLVLDKTPSTRKQKWLAFLFPWGTGDTGASPLPVRGDDFPVWRSKEGQSHAPEMACSGEARFYCRYLWLISAD